MALIQCPDCRGSVSDVAPACPHCGRPNAAAPPVKTELSGLARFLDPKANARSCLGCVAVVVVVAVVMVLLSVLRVW